MLNFVCHLTKHCATIPHVTATTSKGYTRNMTKANTKKTKKKYRPRIKGICAAADALGYSYRHLAMVIRGERHSPRAMAAYRAYLESQQQEAGK